MAILPAMGVGPGDSIKEVNILKVKRAEFHTLREGRDKHGKKKNYNKPCDNRQKWKHCCELMVFNI